MKKQVLVSTMVAVLLSAGLALAAPGFGPDGGCRGKGPMTLEQHEERAENRIERMTVMLDLSAEQQQQIKTLLDQQWEKRQQDREQMTAARDAMHAAMTADNFDEADFRAKAAKHAELRADRMVERKQLRDKIHALLTPEQQEKADSLAELRGERKGMGHGQGKGMGRHGGRGGCF